MSKYKKFKPLSLETNPSNILNVNKERLATYKKSKNALLTRLEPLNCLQSFLIRTMHDYVSSEAKLSAYQGYIINAWERAGLNRGDANKVISRLYGLGPTLIQKLDKNYLSRKTVNLDQRLRRDVSKIDWNKYFSHKKVLSPNRIQRAIETGNLNRVTKKEKAFLSNLAKTYKKRSWRSFVIDKKLKGIASRLITEKRGKYLIKLGKQSEAEHFMDFNSWKDKVKGIIQVQEPEPEIELCSYEWYLERIGHRIVKYDEATGDDPVFVYTCFLSTGIGPLLKVSGPEVYKPDANEKHDNWRESIKDIFPTLYVHHSDVPEHPILVVTAIEDDQYVSNDTQAFVDFGLDVANMLAMLDPTGIASIAVAIIDIAWEIVMIIDWLDENDIVGTSFWELPIETIHKPPEGEYVTQPYSFSPVLGFEGSGSHWEFKIKFHIHSATFL